MKPLELTPELTRDARRCVWFKPPRQAIHYPAHLAAHVLTYGTHEDVKALRKQLSDTDLLQVLDEAPAGVFDPRSWTYWNLVLGRSPAPPLPKRRVERARR